MSDDEFDDMENLDEVDDDPFADVDEDEPLEDPRARSRKIWVSVVAAIVAVSMFVAAAPAVLWPPVLLSILAAFLIWRAAGPRRP